MNYSFPDFIWDPKTKELFDVKSKSFFRNYSDLDSEKRAVFETINNVHQYLSEYGIDGNVGRKLDFS